MAIHIFFASLFIYLLVFKKKLFATDRCIYVSFTSYIHHSIYSFELIVVALTKFVRAFENDNTEYVMSIIIILQLPLWSLLLPIIIFFYFFHYCTIWIWIYLYQTISGRTCMPKCILTALDMIVNRYIYEYEYIYICFACIITNISTRANEKREKIIFSIRFWFFFTFFSHC